MTTPSRPWPPDLARRIDRVCDRFEAAWRAAAAPADAPPVEDFLPALPPGPRAELLCELVALDAEFRRAAGLTPAAADYAAAFPADAELVARALRGEGPPPPADPSAETHTAATSDAAAGETVAPAGVPGRVGRFRVEGVLGEGAFGVVYLARDERLARPVAVKVAKPGVTGDAGRAARFLREARAAAGLAHPNVVAVYDSGEDGGAVYIASAYVAPGRTLKGRLAGGPLRPAEAARVARALAGALAYAHGRKVVHRDVKPSNVLVDDAGEPHLTDFGLATRRDGEETLTRDGQMLGTPLYMAPEQAAGDKEKVGPAADQYALGCVLYEMLTGRPPFAGTVEAVLAAHQKAEPVPPRRLAPGVPAELDAVCLKCLEKEPAGRYADCAALADDLGRFLAGEPVTAKPPTVGRRVVKWCRKEPRLAAAVAALVVLAAAAAVAGVGLTAARGRLAVAEAVAAEREYHRLTAGVRERAARPRPGDSWRSLDDLAAAAKLSPARDELPRLRSDAAGWLAALDLRPVAAGAAGLKTHALAFAPDGRTVAAGQTFSPESGPMPVLLIDAATGATVRELSAPISPEWEKQQDKADGCTSAAFSPDGRWLVVGTRSGLLHRWHLPDGTAAPAASWFATGAVNPEKRFCLGRLAFSPDGRSFYAGRGSPVLTRWDVATWREAARFTGREWVRSFDVSPDGRFAFADDGVLRTLDAATLRPARQDRAVSKEGGSAANLAVTRCGWGLLVHPHGGDPELLPSLDGHVDRFRLAPVTTGPTADSGYHEAVFLAGDRCLALTTRNPYRLELWDALSGRPAVVAPVGQGTSMVAASADGRRLAATSDKGVSLFEATDRGVQTAAGGHVAPVHDFAFAPRGRWLAAVSGADREDVAALVVAPWGPGADPAAGVRVPAEFDNEAYSRERLAESPGVTFAPDGSLATRGWQTSYWRGAFRQAAGPALAATLVPRPHFDPAGRLWFVRDHRVEAWDAAADRPAAPAWDNIEANGTAQIAVRALAVGGRYALAGDRLGLVHVLDAATNRRARVVALGTGQVSAVALSADDRLAAAGTDDGEARLFDPAGGPVTELPRLPEGCASLAFLPGGLLAAACLDGGVRLWHLTPGGADDVLTLPHAGPAEKVALAPDGVTLGVRVRGERAVRLWHLDRLWAELSALGLGEGLPPLPPARPLSGRPRVLDPDELPADSPHGLRVEYFAAPGFAGPPVRTAVVPNIDHIWGDAAPAAGVPANDFAVRFTGTLSAPAPGRYEVDVTADDAARVWLDGEPVLDAWAVPRRNESAVFTAEFGGRPRAFRLEYWEDYVSARCQLRWRPAGSDRPFVPVPPSAFAPAAEKSP